MEKVIIEKINCPRCNAIAEIRTDIQKPRSKLILAYLVCDKCRLTKYQYTTTKKALMYTKKIFNTEKQLQNLPENSPSRRKLCDKIEYMKKLKARAEIDF